MNLPAHKRFLVKFVGLGGRLITAAAAVVFVAQSLALSLRGGDFSEPDQATQFFETPIEQRPDAPPWETVTRPGPSGSQQAAMSDWS